MEGKEGREWQEDMTGGGRERGREGERGEGIEGGKDG